MWEAEGSGHYHMNASLLIAFTSFPLTILKHSALDYYWSAHTQANPCMGCVWTWADRRDWNESSWVFDQWKTWKYRPDIDIRTSQILAYFASYNLKFPCWGFWNNTKWRKIMKWNGKSTWFSSFIFPCIFFIPTQEIQYKQTFIQ